MILQEQGKSIMRAFVNAEYALHNDSKSHDRIGFVRETKQYAFEKRGV